MRNGRDLVIMTEQLFDAINLPEKSRSIAHSPTACETVVIYAKDALAEVLVTDSEIFCDRKQSLVALQDPSAEGSIPP